MDAFTQGEIIGNLLAPWLLAGVGLFIYERATKTKVKHRVVAVVLVVLAIYLVRLLGAVGRMAA